MTSNTQIVTFHKFPSPPYITDNLMIFNTQIIVFHKSPSHPYIPCRSMVFNIQADKSNTDLYMAIKYHFDY